MRKLQEFRIYPIDSNKNQAVGLQLPFNLNSIFTLNYTTQNQVKSNLMNFMLTSNGERVYNVDYGAGIRDLVFEPIFDLEELQLALEDKIKSEFPQINIIGVTVTSDTDNNIMYITVNYSFNSIQDQLAIGLQLT